MAQPAPQPEMQVLRICPYRLWPGREHLDEADRLNEESARLRQQAAELLTPYEGKPILDIPADVLDHASAILEEAQALEEKWNRLMKV